MSEYEGKQEDILSLELPKIDSFKNIYDGREYDITIITGQGELSTICPKTGLPDFATATIVYQPNELCIELKSFKEYITAYREVGIYHEFLANRMLTDIIEAVIPNSISINIEMNPRGNIKTLVDVMWENGGIDASVFKEQELGV